MDSVFWPCSSDIVCGCDPLWITFREALDAVPPSFSQAELHGPCEFLEASVAFSPVERIHFSRFSPARDVCESGLASACAARLDGALVEADGAYRADEFMFFPVLFLADL